MQGSQVGAGIRLNDQYANSHGVIFGRGASVHYCARLTDDVMASLCPYPQAASGQRAAAHEVRSGGAAMVMTLSQPIEAVTMRINPTGGTIDEVFIARVAGFDASGEQIVQQDTRFNWVSGRLFLADIRRFLKPMAPRSRALPWSCSGFLSVIGRCVFSLMI